jgi:hypothetical protein
LEEEEPSGIVAVEQDFVFQEPMAGSSSSVPLMEQGQEEEGMDGHRMALMQQQQQHHVQGIRALVIE